MQNSQKKKKMHNKIIPTNHAIYTCCKIGYIIQVHNIYNYTTTNLDDQFGQQLSN